MAVKATDQITLAVGVDVASVDNYYKLQNSSATPPSKPTTANPTGWSTTEPTYDGTTTNTLYICTKTTLTDNTFYWSAVSVSSSYEAAKQATNLANAANTLATAINNYFWHDTGGAHVGTVEGEAHTANAGYNMTLGATNSNVGIVLEHNADILASFTAQALQFYANGLLSASYNSNGALLYAAVNALAAVVAAFTASGVSFYDGNGTTADNIIAAFGANGAQIGKNSETHIYIDNDSFDIIDDLNRLLTHIDRQGWWRYMPVDQYPDGDDTKPQNPGYDPDNPSTLESYIGAESIDLYNVNDRIIFGDTAPRYYWNDRAGTSGEWSPVYGRFLEVMAKGPSEATMTFMAIHSQGAASLELVSGSRGTLPPGWDPNMFHINALTRFTYSPFVNTPGPGINFRSNERYTKIGVQVPSGSNLMIAGPWHAYDIENNLCSYSELIRTTADDLYLSMVVRRKKADNTEITNGLYLHINAQGVGEVTTSYPAAWRKMLAHDDTNWTYLVGSASVSNWARYRKKAGIVFVQVNYTSGASVPTSGSKLIGTLPSGYRPDLTVSSAAYFTSNNTGSLWVESNGQVRANTRASSAQATLYGTISFPV